MKVGYHGTETWGTIIDRKRAEERESGYALWGYGGATCHPQRQVQPFASGRDVSLVGVPTSSRFVASGKRAKQFSIDGNMWRDLIPGQIVLSSRYALCLGNLRIASGEIPFGGYEIAVGPSVGTRLSEYLRFRCDKACASLMSTSVSDPRPVCLVADIVEPYAVLVR
jgi:hypothetical protein